MKNIKYYFLAIFLFILPFNVFAYSNYDTQFNVDIPDYNDKLSSVSCGENGTMLDSVKYIIDEYNDQYFQLLVGSPSEDGSQIAFYITRYPVIQYYRYEYYGYVNNANNNGANNGVVGLTYYTSSSITSPYYLLTSTNCSTFKNSTGYTNFKYIYNNNLTSNYYPSSGDGLVTSNSSVPSLIFDNREYFNLNNSNSYNTNLWFYYSSRSLSLGATNSSSTYFYYKKVCLVDNDTCYNIGDSIPSYTDLYGFEPPIPEDPTYIGYQDSLKTFYTNLDPSSINNYQLKVHFRVPQSLLGFYQDPQEYIDNTTFNYYCSGRVDYTDYYTYESFPCSLTSSYVLTDSTIDYTFNNVSYSAVLSNYDKIYITIKSNYLDPNVSTTLYNYSYTYSLGSFFNTDYKGSIYEDFTSLPLNFKMYFSSNNSIINSDLYIKKINFINYGLHYIGFDNSTQQQNLVVGESIIGQATNSALGLESAEFIKSTVSNNINSGIMIYQQNSAIPLIKLDLFFNSGIVISLNSSNNDNFYYIDSTGSITNDNFVIPTGINSDKYDISYYINEVNNFINDLSNDSLELGALTQEFYNNLPLFFQTFIFVVFVLACVYFTFLLIRKW